MFGLFKWKRSLPSDPALPSRFPFLFKDNMAAFEFACQYLDCTLTEGGNLPALVLDPRELFGTSSSTKIQQDGTQIATLRVASNDSGFIVFASTLGANGPTLQPGQLVIWQAGRYVAQVAEAAKTKDKRIGWAGLIIATLKPEYREGCWIIDKRLST